MYWGFMLKLSTHMWRDESAGPAGWYLKPQYHVCKIYCQNHNKCHPRGLYRKNI